MPGSRFSTFLLGGILLFERSRYAGKKRKGDEHRDDGK
jgi:hypothetical protein